jgi:DNA-binding MarR family transcriptional regulator
LAKTLRQVLAIEEHEIKKGPLKDLSISEIHTIEAIGMYSAKTMSQLATALSISIGAVTATINNLVKKGYVIRERDESDRRLVKVSLTKPGKIAYRIHEKFHLDMVKKVMQGLADRERILIASLEKLHILFQEKYSLNIK